MHRSRYYYYLLLSLLAFRSLMNIQTDCDESSDVDFDATHTRMDANWLASGSISYDSNVSNPSNSFAENFLLICATFQIFSSWISVKDVVSLDAALKKGKKVLNVQNNYRRILLFSFFSLLFSSIIQASAFVLYPASASIHIYLPIAKCNSLHRC